MRPETPHEVFRSRVMEKVRRAISETDFMLCEEMMCVKEKIKPPYNLDDIDRWLEDFGEAMGEVLAERLNSAIEAMDK